MATLETTVDMLMGSKTKSRSFNRSLFFRDACNDDNCRLCAMILPISGTIQAETKAGTKVIHPNVEVRMLARTTPWLWTMAKC